MKGPRIRAFPRMELRNAIEHRAGDKTFRIEKPLGNLSVGGLFVKCEDLPVDGRSLSASWLANRSTPTG